MTEASRVIRWMMTTSETYSTERPTDGYSTKLPGGESWLSFPATGSNLGPVSHAHREARIRARQEAAMAIAGVGNTKEALAQDIRDLRARIERMAVDVSLDGTGKRCELCGGEWPVDGDIEHVWGCLLHQMAALSFDMATMSEADFNARRDKNARDE